MTRRAALGDAVAALLIVWPSGQTAASQDFGTVAIRLSPWRQLVDAHEPGEVDEAVREIATWSAAQLATTGDLVRELSQYTEVGGLVQRGAVLYLDAVVAGLARTIGPVPPRLLQPALLSRDSRGEARGSASVHLAAARLLLDSRPDIRNGEFGRHWYRATTAWLAAAHKLADLKPHLESAARAFGSDAATAFDRGCLYEAFGSRRVRAVIDTTRQPGLSFDVPPVRASLAEAARHFRRALEIDPAMVEARVRLGRVLLLVGQEDDGARELGRALAETARQDSRFDALLFLGRAAENRDDLDEAHGHFAAASSLYPHAQSARLALARLAGARGAENDERREVAAVLGLARERLDSSDPWWTYHDGIGRDVDVLLADLRQKARELR